MHARTQWTGVDTLEPELRRAFQRRALLLARPISGVLALFYVLVAGSHWLPIADGSTPLMLASSLLAIITLSSVYFGLRLHYFPPDRQPFIAFVLTFCVGGNILLRLYLGADPAQSSVLVLAILAFGVLVATLRAQLLVVAFMGIGWLAIAIHIGPLEVWLEQAPYVLAAGVLSLAITAVHSRVVVANLSLAWNERRRGRVLGRALDDMEATRGALRGSEANLRGLIETTDAIVFSVDENLRVLVWNDRFAETVRAFGGFEVEVGHPLEAIVPSVVRREWIERYRRVLAGRSEQEDVTLAVGDASRTFEASLGPIRTLDGRILGVATYARDITNRKATEEALRASRERLHHDARHDALTGLPNRALFFERLSEVWDATRNGTEPAFAVLFVDLDRFKVVNDSLGHTVGDRLLVALGARLQHNLRPGDTIARVGGDEFALLLRNLESLDIAHRVASRLQETVSAPFEIDGFSVHTSASIGIAVHQDLHEQPDELLRDADLAMYDAKNSGKARHRFYDGTMHRRALDRLELEVDLRRALEREELRLHYQPIVALEDGRIVAVEALVRWPHPTRGLLNPHEFLGLAEETGLILKLGGWVLDEACRQLGEWHERHEASLCMSVNLSDQEVARSGLAELVEETLERHHLDPGTLWLEVTETVVNDSLLDARDRLSSLRERGVRICIDDFGTGYSALSQLGRYAFDLLKVDRNFFAPEWGGTAERDVSDVAEAVLSLARGLGMEPIAEGLQSSEQVDELRRLGFPFGQGHYFAQALPAEEVEALLEAGTLRPALEQAG